MQCSITLVEQARISAESGYIVQAKVGAPAGHRGDASTGMAGSSSRDNSRRDNSRRGSRRNSRRSIGTGWRKEQWWERRAQVGSTGAQVESVVGGVIGGVV